MKGFNPRTRTGCDPTGMERLPGYWFQSTHPHGVRLTPRPKATVSPCFNPRTRTGCDRHCWLYRAYTKVSIHAPARGATMVQRLISRQVVVSIHAPARGATLLSPLNTFDFKFQSTHPHGVRLTLKTQSHDLRRFNPRTRTGCDLSGALCALHAKGFNPRTRTGCDAAYAKPSSKKVVSIHAPARGATAEPKQGS